MGKPALEFHAIENIRWKRVTKSIKKGKAWEKILSRDKDGNIFTRLYKLDPGCETKGVLSHDFWEEIYILEGGLVDLRKRKIYTVGMYACRPPGMKHGPFAAPVGCLLFEVRYKCPTKTAKS
jgi:quercetin dioxygenase-like cupin family protein